MAQALVFPSELIDLPLVLFVSDGLSAFVARHLITDVPAGNGADWDPEEPASDSATVMLPMMAPPASPPTAAVFPFGHRTRDLTTTMLVAIIAALRALVIALGRFICISF
jgi:hypothetical protein